MELERFIKEIRIQTLKMISKSKASHVGSCLSCADILGVLYHAYLNINHTNKNSPDRDYMVMSKGHAAAALYSALALKKIIPMEYLDFYCCNNAKLAGHVTYEPDMGIEISTGSLGHGLPVALGIAYALKLDIRKNKVVVLLSDGECQEGSNWEAFLSSPRLSLDNLTIIIDYNKIQGYDRTEDVWGLGNLGTILKSLGWKIFHIDGHDTKEIIFALCEETSRPKAIIADTVKGKGVSFMEGKLEWHYKFPNEEQLNSAIKEIRDS